MKQLWAVRFLNTLWSACKPLYRAAYKLRTAEREQREGDRGGGGGCRGSRCQVGTCQHQTNWPADTCLWSGSEQKMAQTLNTDLTDPLSFSLCLSILYSCPIYSEYADLGRWTVSGDMDRSNPVYQVDVCLLDPESSPANGVERLQQL